MPCLMVLNGPNHGRILSLSEGTPCRLGRDPGLDLCIDDAKASRVHVILEYKEGQWILRDLRSRNGTQVNGTRITAQALKESDQIQIGDTRLAFSLRDAPPSDPRSHMDSLYAPRIPLGVRQAGDQTLPAAAGEAFETLALNAPLASLRLETGPQPAVKGMATVLGAPPVQVTPAGLERANRCLRALYALGRVCAESSSTRELLARVTPMLRDALEADRVTPLLLDAEGHWHAAEVDVLPQARPSGTGARSAGFSRVPVSRTIVDYALRSRCAVLTTPRSDSRFEGARSVGEQGITSAMCVPILWGEEPLGLVYADRLGGQDFDRADQEMLAAACLQAAPVLAHLKRLEEIVAQKERLLAELKSEHHLLGECPRMKEVYAFIERAAPSESGVLVLGESGTGKELVARAMHYNSPRRDKPLVIVNCAALTESLIESELFGHVKGAFTGATTDRVGCFEMAHEGTIFLDEIGELSNACQTKLLRVIEHGEIARVGESRIHKVNVRLVAATNRELAAEVKSGRFREDLFYRLNVLTLSLPPLRERQADIPLLAEHYLHSAAMRCGRPRLKFSEEALATLGGYRWPGNVRELRNLTERLAVLCPSEIIGQRDLPPEVRELLPALSSAVASRSTVALPRRALDPAGAPPGAEALPAPPVSVPPVAAPRPPSGPTTSKSLAVMEREHILRVLEQCGGNKKQAAEALAIDRSTLYAKLRAYGIVPS